MGIRDLFTNKKQENIKKEEPSTLYTMTLENGDKVILYGINKQTTIKHRGNELEDLMVARIAKYKGSDAILFDMSDYMAFELPQNQEMNKQIAQAVISGYIQESSQRNKDSQQSYYLGRLMQYENGCYFSNKSDYVNQLVEDLVKRDKEELQRKNELLRREREKNEKQRLYRESLSIHDYEQEMERTKEKRLANPKLEIVNAVQINGKTYYDYDGINTNTGDILRIRRTDKVCKEIMQDRSQVYLYSAYLYNTPNQHDVEMLYGQENYAVCFELPGRLEDIVKTNNQTEIKQILELLSDSRSFENPGELTYIGEINKYGQANHKEMSNSPAMQEKIESMKREFKEQIQKARQNYGRYY